VVRGGGGGGGGGGVNFQDSLVVCLHKFQFKTLVGEITMLP